MQIELRPTERSGRAWFWKVLAGPASLLDGVCETLTLGFVSIGAKLAVTRRLAQARTTNFRKPGGR